MKRYSSNKRQSRKAFNHRAKKTQRLNKSLSRRGGIRL